MITFRHSSGQNSGCLRHGATASAHSLVREIHVILRLPFLVQILAEEVLGSHVGEAVCIRVTWLHSDQGQG